ncbi:MAG: isoprenylcysteine carboxylmethyltransferase family protein [Acidobacteria bacterium]|nr:isoprenylcysteine carboxylmethyltransferase family protein [Acidobacteriota bacterium]
MHTSADSPGVHVPPPLFFAAAVVGDWLLDRPWPLPIGGGAARTTVAWVFVAAWAGLGAGAIGAFRRHRTSPIPFRPATTLVTAGPYTFTRNPMYVSLALLTLGLALFLNTWWAVVLLVPALVAVQQFVIGPEERYLRRRFGAEYDQYTRQVRRWL